MPAWRRPADPRAGLRLGFAQSVDGPAPSELDHHRRLQLPRPAPAYRGSGARPAGLTNLTVITADANKFEPEGQFDRVVSVEMFEHMANWAQLLGRARTWLRPEGRLFLHVFSSRTAPYRFTHEDPNDWIGKYFFTGGFMPSHDLIRDFDDLFTVEADWRWNGKHYEQTALDWLANMDRHDLAIRRATSTVGRIMRPSRRLRQGRGALASRRWRLFFLATLPACSAIAAARSGASATIGWRRLARLRGSIAGEAGSREEAVASGSRCQWSCLIAPVPKCNSCWSAVLEPLPQRVPPCRRRSPRPAGWRHRDTSDPSSAASPPRRSSPARRPAPASGRRPGR
jgi:SAM-dependent methyltransferase